MAPKPGDSLSENVTQNEDLSSDSEMDEDTHPKQWESRIIGRILKYKKISDELKEAGCPLFNGRNYSKLSPQLKEKAAKLDNKLDSLMEFSTNYDLTDHEYAQLHLYIAQGSTWQNFKKTMKLYDFSLKCNSVWSSDTIAYRCTTCALNPCMSLCSKCFKNGEHEGHDFSRFFSQAGGACDCGNIDVLHEFGFCKFHGPNAAQPPKQPPNLISLTEFIIPKLFVRMFVMYRGWHKNFESYLQNRQRVSKEAIVTKDSYCNAIVDRTRRVVELIQEMIDTGAPLRDKIASVLLDTQLYTDLNSREMDDDFIDAAVRRADLSLDWRTRRFLEDDFKTLDVSNVDFSFRNLMDELIFWIFRLYFPQNLINLSLSMLSNMDYRIYYGRRFFSLYPCISNILLDVCRTERIPVLQAMSTRIIHISVQILSGDALSLAIDEDINVKCILVNSVRDLLEPGKSPSFVTQATKYFYSNSPPKSVDESVFRWPVFSIDSNHPILKHAYWTVVSDLQNLLMHPKILQRFIEEDYCIEAFASIVQHLQGLNLNYRVVSGDHVEYDIAKPYRLSFNLEFEISSTLMFSSYNSLSRMNNQEYCIAKYLKTWRDKLKIWFEAIGMEETHYCTPPFQLTYHIPLHRQLSAGIMRCIYTPKFNFLLDEIINDELFLRYALLHPLRIQVARAETSAGMWARNGNSARNQSYIYAQPSYSSAFLDSDISLIKFIASKIHPEKFFDVLITSFYLCECFAFLDDEKGTDAKVVVRWEWLTPLIDGALRLLLEIVTIHWDIGSSDPDSLFNEIVAALAVGDLTYSKLRSVIPEQGGKLLISSETFDTLLQKVAKYNEPDRGSHIQQGVYCLYLDSWEHYFNPVFCRMRASAAREYNDAILRAEEAERQILSRFSALSPKDQIWIPFQLIGSQMLTSSLLKTYSLLVCPSFFAVIHKLLLSYLKHEKLNDSPLQQAIFLLTLSVEYVISDAFNRSADVFTREGFSNAPSFPYSFYRMKPNKISGRDYVLSMFTFSDCGPSILDMILMHLERVLGVQNASNCGLAVAQAIKKYSLKKPEDLQRISGYAADYIGRLLCLLYHGSSSVRHVLDALMAKADQECKGSNEDVSSDLSAKSKEEKRLKAKRRQEALLAAQKRKNDQLMKKLMNKEGITETQIEKMDTTEDSSTEMYNCNFCNDTTVNSWSNTFGLLVNVTCNYAVEHSLPAEEPSCNLIEMHRKLQENDHALMNMKEFQSLKNELLKTKLTRAIYCADETLFSAGVEVRACGHFAHLKCFLSYMVSLKSIPPISRPDLACPMCRTSLIGILPIKPHTENVDHMEVDSHEKQSNTCFKQKVEAIKKSIEDEQHQKKSETYKHLSSYNGAFDQLVMAYLESRQRTSGYHSLPNEIGLNENSETPSTCSPWFKLWLARANCEFNILLSELNFPVKDFRVRPTELLVQGAHPDSLGIYTMQVLKQWEWLTKGFYEPNFDLSSSENLVHLHTAYFDASADKSGVVPSDTSILASSDEEEKMNAQKLKAEIDEDLRLPFVLFDMKSSLIRLSAYVLTNVFLNPDGKREQLAFIYHVVLFASMVRAATFTATRLTFQQYKDIMQQKVDRCGLNDMNNVFSYVIVSSIQRLFCRSTINVEELLERNVHNVDLFDALHSVCTDLSRFTAQLWHECHIKSLPSEMQLGCTNFLDIHFFLTGKKELSIDYLPAFTIAQLVADVSRHMNLPNYHRVMIREPFKWRRLILLELPPVYETLFSYFFGQNCSVCASIPRNPLVCMLCAQLLCLDSCCNTVSPGRVPSSEFLRHASECGSGNCCFFSINTSLIVLTCHRKSAIWGSVYLDKHGEEDRNLRRGKPLYLSQRRYALLCESWLLQDFDQRSSVSFFNNEHLPTFLRESHHVLSID